MNSYVYLWPGLCLAEVVQECDGKVVWGSGMALLSFGAVWAINKRLVGSGNRATATAVPSEWYADGIRWRAGGAPASGMRRRELVLASGSTCCCGQRVARIVVTLFAADG